MNSTVHLVIAEINLVSRLYCRGVHGTSLHFTVPGSEKATTRGHLNTLNWALSTRRTLCRDFFWALKFCKVLLTALLYCVKSLHFLQFIGGVRFQFYFLFSIIFLHLRMFNRILKEINKIVSIYIILGLKDGFLYFGDKILEESFNFVIHSAYVAESNVLIRDKNKTSFICL